MRKQSEWYADAVEQDPSGVTCGYCGRPNDFWDDCGWFYVAYYKFFDAYVLLLRTVGWDKCRDMLPADLPCCRSCWNGPIGQSHVRMHGLGER